MSSGISWHKNANFWLNCFVKKWNDLDCALHLMPMVGKEISMSAASHARTTTTLSCFTHENNMQSRITKLIFVILVLIITYRTIKVPQNCIKQHK